MKRANILFFPYLDLTHCQAGYERFPSGTESTPEAL